MNRTKPYGVYARTDDEGRVVAINSDAFLQDTTEWTRIDEGYGDRYHHAQGNYLHDGIVDEHGVCRYKVADGALVERSDGEMDADAAQIVVPPSPEARIAALEAQNAMLTECLMEMSEMVYA